MKAKVYSTFRDFATPLPEVCFDFLKPRKQNISLLLGKRSTKPDAILQVFTANIRQNFTETTLEKASYTIIAILITVF